MVSAQTPQQMVDALLQYPERTRFQILAPVVRGRKGEFEDLLELLRGDGYARALIDGEMRQLSDDIKLAKQKKHTIEVVVDRLVVKDGIRQRLTDSIETALKLAKGIVVPILWIWMRRILTAVSLFPKNAHARTGISLNLMRLSRARSRSTPRTVPARYARASDTSWRLIRNW